MISYDINLNTTTEELTIKNGDFLIAASDEMHIEDIIASNPGDWQEYPNVGASIESYINGSDLYQLTQNIKNQLKSDGYNTNSLNITYNQSTSLYSVEVDANRQ